MKKKILRWSVVLLAVTGIFLWFFVQEKVTADTTAEGSEQNFVITSVQADVEGLDVEANIKCVRREEGSRPNFVFTCVNNGNVDMVTMEYKVFYMKDGEWQELLIDSTYFELLYSNSIICMDTLNEINSQLETPVRQTNETTFCYTPWHKFLNMNQLGEYRFELTIGKMGDGIDEKLGTVWVEWTQELK